MTRNIGVYNDKPLLTHDVEEGTFTVNDETLDITTGADIITGTFGTQVNAENFLNAGAGAVALKRVAAGETATYFNPYKPQVNGQLPNETTTQANMPTKRYVGAQRLEPGEWLLPLIDTNQAIAVGDKLIVAATGDGLDKTATTTNVAKAKQAKALNEGGYILVELETSALAVASS